MSYILEALKKSDQQRQRGTTPTLQAAQLIAVAPQRPMSVYYGLLALALLATGITAGITINWLRSQPQSMPVKVEPVTRQPAAPTALSASPELPGDTAHKSASQSASQSPSHDPAGQAVPVADVAQPYKPPRAAEPVAAASVRDESAGAAQDNEAISLDELPAQIRQEIPAMDIQLHAYSSVPAERLVSINSIRLREGGALMLGLRLEQITPDGMIFSYKGYRFRRGAR